MVNQSPGAMPQAKVEHTAFGAKQAALPKGEASFWSGAAIVDARWNRQAAQKQFNSAAKSQ